MYVTVYRANARFGSREGKKRETIFVIAHIGAHILIMKHRDAMSLSAACHSAC